MQLSKEQVERFRQDGFLVLPGLFAAAEVAILRSALEEAVAAGGAGDIREQASGEIRTAMGLQRRHPVFERAVRHPRLVEPALQLAGKPLYVQQVKVNVKAAFDGEPWQWHYDFATHHREDGVPRPEALNLHIFLDAVTEFNGPLFFIPGSHRHGAAETRLDRSSTSYPLWVVDPPSVKQLASAGGMVAATGPAGTALIFGDQLLHASPANISPWDRPIFSVILNPIENALTRHERPDYKHHRDLSPVTPLADDCLREANRPSLGKVPIP